MSSQQLDLSTHDVRATSWPFGDATLDSLRYTNRFHLLSAPQRIRFMEEAWRVLKPGGTLEVTVPHARSESANTPDAVWPPLVESSFLYFDAKARADMFVSHYAINCDFAVAVSVRMEAAWEARPKAEQMYATHHLNGAVAEMTAILTKRAAQ